MLSIGRLNAKRIVGNRLVFLDITENGQRVQTMCNFREIDGLTLQSFKTAFHELQRGDVVRKSTHVAALNGNIRLIMIQGLTGRPDRTATGELTLRLSTLPKLMSPCLHSLPTELRDPETRIRNRSLDFMVNPKSTQVILAKSEITQYLRQFFLEDGQTEVQTPILAEAAGGATARPFVTTATEFYDRRLSLRIAPELWLKRLVVGGFDRVFEIGPSFRNEGTVEVSKARYNVADGDLMEALILLTILNLQPASSTVPTRIWKS